MAKEIISIPPKQVINPQTGEIKPLKKKVAGYARVSTDSDEQFTSYEAQIDYYTNYIKGRSDWQFVKVYTDEGISGTSTKKRDGFNEMIKDALDGKIDLIVTKSVSRFARNTVDSLTTVRTLKERGVEIYFEKENIWTLDSKGELLITIMSSLAQEESRSISENVTWGRRKQFADGKYTMAYKTFLGYTKGPDGGLVVVPEEAEIVKRIYGLFLSGYSTAGIATMFNEEKVPITGNAKEWYPSKIRNILSNEKYKGDALLQKTYCVDFLTKERVVNNGEVQQYYIKDDHEAIIETEIFDLVQVYLNRSSDKDNYGYKLFVDRIRCGSCGGIFTRRIWHSTTKDKCIAYTCHYRYRSEKCKSPSIREVVLKEVLTREINKVISNRKKVFDEYDEVNSKVLDTDTLVRKKKTLVAEAMKINNQLNGMTISNAATLQDQEAFISMQKELTDKYNSLTGEIKALEENIQSKQSRLLMAKHFVETLKEEKNLTDGFDEDIFRKFVDEIVINDDNTITIVFKGGFERTTKI